MLSAVDWLVVATYGAGLALIGRWAAREGGDPFLADRRVPAWAASFSVVATVLSAATFVGGPQQAFRGDWTYMVFKLAGLPALVIVGLLFLPRFYAAGTASIYGVLRQRYGEAAGRDASLAFLGGRLLASGARLFMAGIPLSWALFQSAELPQLALSIALVAAATGLYAVRGGMRAVVWTDVLQALVAVAVGVAGLVTLWGQLDLPLEEVLRLLQGGERDKLRVLDPSTAPDAKFTVWTGLLGLPLFLVAAYAVDQDHVQRLMTCRTPREALWAGVGSNLIGWPVTLLFLALGSLLWVAAETQGTALVDASGDDRAVLVQYMLAELPLGLRGLMVAGVLAAAMSSLDSALNAMAATTLEDLVEPRRARRGQQPLTTDERSTLARRLSLGWALTLGALALLLAAWQEGSGRTLLEFALGVMSYAYAGLLGVFAVALFTRRGSAASVRRGLVTGALVILATEPRVQGLVIDSTALAFPWRLTLGALLAAGVTLGASDAPRGKITAP